MRCLFILLLVMLTNEVQAVDYPAWRQDKIVDDYFGRKISDPYRWLEGELKDVAAFIEKQNALTSGWIPREVRDQYFSRLKALIDYPRCSLPSHEGRFWTTMRNTGLQAHSALYKQEGLEGTPEILLDPNTFSPDGTVALSAVNFNEDGTLLAYGKSIGGSDDQTIHVRDAVTGQDRADVLRDMRFSNLAWAKDSSGFWYNRYPNPEKRADNPLYWHRLGDEQAADRPVLALPDEPEVMLSPSITEGGEYLFVYKSQGTSEKNGLLARPLTTPEGEAGGFREIFPMEVASFGVVENDGSLLYVYTDKDAPRKRLIAVDAQHPEEANWKEILPQSEDLLTDVALIDGRWAAVYSRDVHSIVKIFEKDGTFVREVPLPTTGTVGGLSGRVGDKEMLFIFSSYTYPGTIYRYVMQTGEIAEYYRSKIKFDSDHYETRQIFVKSKDGTRVPVFVTARKDLARDGSHPAILYGYGGFNVSLQPYFDPMVVPWLENGGVYAVAILRGGGEYGSAWHEGGMLGRKQNVFDDFAAAAEGLITEKYTRPDKLAIEGGSNGGLLVAASLLQRPELFGAGISQVPVTDMLRYQKFGTGRFWTVEYGDASARREDFTWLSAYSPLHNVIQGKTYPPLLVTTADGDDRVAPAHAFKFVATMQAQAGSGVYLLRHETGAGHGAGKPLDKVLSEQADVYAFLTRALGIGKTPGR